MLHSDRTSELQPFCTPPLPWLTPRPSRPSNVPFVGLLVVLIAALAGCQGDSGDSTTSNSNKNGSAQTLKNADQDSASLQGDPPVSVGDPWFEPVTDETGITFVHNSGNSEVRPFPAANGSGVGAIDYDLDGWLDLFFATGTDFPVDLNSSSRDHLYRNLGDFQFDSVAEEAGVDFGGYSVGVTVGDYDNDGFPDFYLSCYGENLLYHNQGDGSFRRVEQVAGVNEAEWSTSPMWFDADGDGDLDLYVCNYGYWTLETNGLCQEQGVRLFCSPKTIKACRDTLFVNQGDGTFLDETVARGLEGRGGRAQGVVAADLNDDGSMDLYLGNDLHANSLFLNDGTGHFTDQTELSGVAYDHKGNSQAGMGVDAADTNRDGRFDLFVTNFKDEYNSLYEARAPGLFFEVSTPRGVALDSLPYVAWGTGFGDFNLDGWLDLYVVNGHVDTNREETGEDAPYTNPDLVWINNEGRFQCLQAGSGLESATRYSSRGMALVDLDNDGDEDVVVVNQDAPPALVRNLRLSPDAADDAQQSAAIKLSWIGTQANRTGIGVSYRHLDGEKPFVDQVTGGGSYLSSSDPRTTLAVPTDSTQLTLQVRFPGGQQQTIEGLEPGNHYAIIESPDADSAPTVVPLD